jgi:predicted TIM-barrel fold metal-dependent hydrolase
MEQSGIAISFVLADSEPNTLVSDLDTTCKVVGRCPKLKVLGSISPLICDPGTVIGRLDALACDKAIIGVKLYPGFELFYPDDESCHAIYELCVAHNMPVLFHSGESMNEPWREKYNHPGEIAKVASRFPPLKIIIAHFSQPHLMDCRDVILEYPNVHGDISGLAHPEVMELCGKEIIHQVVHDVASTQPGKVLFGTDWPICDVGDHLQLVSSLKISDSTKSLILWENARRLFNLEGV